MFSKALPYLLLCVLHLLRTHIPPPTLKLLAIEADVVEVSLSVLRLVNLASEDRSFLLRTHLLVLLKKFWCELVVYCLGGYG